MMKRVAVITYSDKGYRGEREDLSGPAVKEIRLGFLPNENGKSAEIKRNIILSLLAIVIQIFTLVSNL